MPESVRHRQGKVRAAITGEHPSASRAGLGRDGSLGFDSCTQAQRQFRALLALHLFNTGIGPPYTAASAFLTYTVAMSPRHNLLAVIRRGAIPNLAGRLLPNPGHGIGRVSGLRVAGVVPFRLYDLVHVPTGARMVISDQEHFLRSASSDIPDKMFGPRGPGLDVPVDTSEQRVADMVAALPDPMLRLMAGLVVRFCTVGPGKRWSLGYWSTEWSELSGIADRWEMRWHHEPDPSQVACALTDPIAGIAGAQAVAGLGGRYIDVVLDGARLRLRRRSSRGE
jgi:hypothetical protein